jgi:hypothetical protein
MKRAFILCRPADMQIARACQNRMQALGWIASVMIDRGEWPELPENVILADYGTQGRGMFGNKCANAIMDGIIAHSHPGDVVMKMDCDVWISDEANDWLSQVGQAKTYSVEYGGKIQPWGGMWSATHEHVVTARVTADTLERCRCAESYLNLKALHRTPPLLHVNETLVTQWEPGGSLGIVATLPITRRKNRGDEGMALFMPPAESV